MATTVAPLASGERAGKKAPLHSSTGITRRSFVGLSLLCPPAAKAATARAPEGYKVFRDNLDGYEIAHPDDWTAGSDVFFRSPKHPDETFYVDVRACALPLDSRDLAVAAEGKEGEAQVSSPKGYKFSGLEDLGSKEDALKRFVDQFQNEFQSTRIGITREVIPRGASSRSDDNGNLFYDMALTINSYATENQAGSGAQFGIQPEARPQKLEFTRRAMATWAVANGRLYELRLQVSENDLESEEPVLDQIRRSFRPFEVQPQ